MKLKSITIHNVNQKLLSIQYNVRGPLVERAKEIDKEIHKGVKYPFERVLFANIGDCQALGQRPVTFVRQVLALASCPTLLSSPDFPYDVKERAQDILAECAKGTVGAYSPSPGLPLVRRSVAEHLAARDGIPASWQDIFIGAGATDVLKATLSMFVEDVDRKPSGVMIPVPQYPLFSGFLTEMGLRQVDYFLDEEDDWALTVEELERSWREASADCSVKVLIIINPGNPTGQVLTRINIEGIIKFAYDHNLFIMADEVYQDNIINKPFYSFKRVMHDMGAPYSSMELGSFASSSKGWSGECGLRCGFVELLRLEPRILEMFSTMRSVMQCPSVLGQCILYCVTKPPKQGDPSYEQFVKEKTIIQQSLKETTTIAYEYLNTIPGYSCSRIDAAMFAFPRVEIPARAQAAARDLGLQPDEFYCSRLLEETGVCVVDGSGFGQKLDTFHFRGTVAHPLDDLYHMLDSLRTFQIRFLQTYS